MRARRLIPILVIALAFVVNVSARFDIPAKLTDQEFWKLSNDISEPDGTFRSDNLLSNEMTFGRLVPDLVAKTKPGGVYLGVGPEQNFTYMVHMKPKMAFITDIRRANLHVLLMYKAAFELSANRADFISLVFSKPRPAGLTTSTSIKDMMDAFWGVATGPEDLYTANLAKIQNHLTKTRAIALPQVDLDGIAAVYRAFYWYGLRMNYSATISLGNVGTGGATYYDLMTQVDANGQPLTYLASEQNYNFIKDMETRNMIIPIVGNFSGPKAIRGIGAYLKSRNATVTAFYVSTVEPYLKRDGSFPTFCANVATLPMDDASVFIRPGNLTNLQASGFAVAPPSAETPRLGSYQIGVIVPMKGGCN